MIEKNDQMFEILYSLKGATLENITHDVDANSIHVGLNKSVGGQLIISIPHELLNAKIGTMVVDNIFLLIDGEENMHGENIVDDEIIITVWFPKDTQDVEIIGAYWT